MISCLCEGTAENELMEYTAWKLDTVDEDEVVSWVMKCQHESAVGLMDP